MAGPGLLNTPIVIQQRQPARAPPRMQHLIEAKVSVAGRTFCTLIREGASVNELIEKVARENGGCVEKKYYPEFKTWEITRVQMGDVLLMKGKEGIHFGLGTSGIPMASAGEQIVFPNAEELRVGRETSTIGLWMTSANFDPGRVADLNHVYSSTGGVRLSDDARKKLEESHGGARSEKLLLHDNILVLDKETGEIRTASEHAAKIAVEGFAAPQFQTPTYTTVGLTMASDRGVLAVPMDGSAVRVPYLFVKSFDGRITDHLSIQFNPLRAEAPARPKEREQPRPDAQPMCFSAACGQVNDGTAAGAPTAAAPHEIPPAIKQTVKSSGQPIHAPLTPETITYFWHNPRPAPQELPCTLKPAPAIRRRFPGAMPLMRRILEKADEARKEAVKNQARPEAVARPGRRKRRRSLAVPPLREPSKKEAIRKKEKKPREAETTPSAARRRKKRKEPQSHFESVRLKKQARMRPGALILPKAQKPPTAPKARIAAPKPELLKAKPRARAKSSAAARESMKAKPRDAKKKLPAYFMMGLLGLLAKRKRRFRRGRAAAGN
ncbi:MAG: hypothetical protein PHV13_04570 [Candidatus ainarchaeum sp.]|nr:hypothetical protein [Candidatus ainarchaeum sp.]